MADTFKVLAQVNPSAGTLTDAYTVPGAKSATVSSIVVCNEGASTDKFRIAIAVAAAADTPKQYLYYDQEIPGNKSFAITLGLTLATTDVIRVYAGGSSLAFNIFGVEVS